MLDGKKILIYLLMISLLFTTGYWDRAELEDLAYVLLMAVDYSMLLNMDADWVFTDLDVEITVTNKILRTGLMQHPPFYKYHV